MENQTIQQDDPGKTVAILSYCTLVGVIIALVMNGDQKNKSELGVLHLRQGLGIMSTGIAMMIASMILIFIPIIGWIIAILINISYIAIFIFWILGLIAAVQGEKKVVPVLGAFYQKLFAGIK